MKNKYNVNIKVKIKRILYEDLGSQKYVFRLISDDKLPKRKRSRFYTLYLELVLDTSLKDKHGFKAFEL